MTDREKLRQQLNKWSKVNLFIYACEDFIITDSAKIDTFTKEELIELIINN